MGRPSGDCNCHCGSGAGGGGGGLPTPPPLGSDPGCDILCTHGFLFGVHAPAAYPTWVDDTNWTVPTIKYEAKINSSGVSDIKLSHNNYISVYNNVYGSENVSIGSGNAFVLMSPYSPGTENHNTFASGHHYILNASGVPYFCFNPYYSFDSNKMLAQQDSVIDTQKFNSLRIIPETDFGTIDRFSIDYDINPFLFGNLYTEVTGVGWNWNCYSYNWWFINSNDFPLTLGFRKLSLQHHDTVNKKYYWIPYINESEPCANFFYNTYNYWYSNWDTWYYYGGLFLGSSSSWSIQYDYGTSKYYLSNFTGPEVIIDYSHDVYGTYYDPEYGPCYYYYVAQNASDTNLYFNPGENVNISILSYLAAQGLELGGGLSFLYSARITEDNPEQWAQLANIGLDYCIPDGYIYGTTTTECGYVAPFEIDITISTCCGELYLATMYITFNQTECE